jgi:hypothetical protein
VATRFENPFPEFWNPVGRSDKECRLQPPSRLRSSSSRTRARRSATLAASTTVLGELLALCPSIPQSCPDTFRDKAALQLGDRTQYRKDHPARRRSRVERLRQAHELDS